MIRRTIILTAILLACCAQAFYALPVWQVQTSAAVGNPNLVGWWKLDGDALDSSGYGNHGTIVGSPTNATDWTGAPGKALGFSGSGQHINIANTAGLNITNRPLTLMAWVRPTTESIGWVFSRTEDAVNETQYGMTIANTNTSAAYLNGTQRGFINPGAKWTHVAFVWQADGIPRTYTNAVLAVSASSFTGTLTSRQNIKIAARSSAVNGSTATALFTGQLDDIRVYKQELTPAQIATAMNGGQP